ncbi:hypothetical protein [Zymobacter sp. IVIA_12111.31 C1]|uniref:hypothetical protein n=1 Tax=Zymobacter sp. IVIA_12111.31 C1 TaxID=3394854 RepID=UPI0039C205E1
MATSAYEKETSLDAYEKRSEYRRTGTLKKIKIIRKREVSYAARIRKNHLCIHAAHA